LNVEKERTGDGGTSTIREQKQSSESVLQTLWSVNEDSVTKDKQMSGILIEQIDMNNMPEVVRMYFIGKLYEIRKSEVASQRRGHVVHSKYPCKRYGKFRETADYVADEIGMAGSTVKRYGLFAKGIDAVKAVDNETAWAILHGEVRVKKNDIIAIGMADHETQRKLILETAVGKPVRVARIAGKPRSRKKDLNRIAECVSSLFDETENEYGIDRLLNDIRMNSEPFVNRMRQLISQHEPLCRSHWHTVVRTINENIIYKLIDSGEEITP